MRWTKSKRDVTAPESRRGDHLTNGNDKKYFIVLKKNTDITVYFLLIKYRCNRRLLGIDHVLGLCSGRGCLKYIR